MDVAFLRLKTARARIRVAARTETCDRHELRDVLARTNHGPFY